MCLESKIYLKHYLDSVIKNYILCKMFKILLKMIENKMVKNTMYK